MANDATAMAGKDFARCIVGDPSAMTMLSVAVAGGAHTLRKAGAERHAGISLHGNWPHIHLGALEAIYGRAPYYPHLIPAIRGIITNPPGSLASLNINIHRVFTEFLSPIEFTGVATGCAAAERGEEITRLIDPKLSIIDPLMRFGKETLLALL